MTGPALLWLRRDMRLADHPALTAAVGAGPVLAVFVLEPQVRAFGAASLWRLDRALAHHAAVLAARGVPMVLRQGPADAVIPALARETGAVAVHWSRRYDPEGVETDRRVKAALKDQGTPAQSHPGFLLHEPWAIRTAAGGDFRVFTPFWRAMRQVPQAPVLPPPPRLVGWHAAPMGDDLAAWRLGARMQRGAAVLARHARIGADAAWARLDEFTDHALARYPEGRDQMAEDGTSGLSEALTWGEISPRQIWARAEVAMAEGNPGAEAFLRQIAWRDFAWHLFWHRRDMDRANWAAGWEDFPWARGGAALTAWQRGQTGEPLVDAAMRALYATGRMHNRARMVVASYLTKHLLTDWREGLAWFADCLTDWDPAANAMGWQWVAGSGPDAAPFFRIFNPEAQAAKFDPSGAYRRLWAPDNPDFRAAIPRSWDLQPAPPPMVSLAGGRARALAAYAAARGQAGSRKA